MNRRDMLKGSLATIGALTLFAGKAESSTDIKRPLVSMEWVQEQYYNGTMERRWIPKEYLYDMDSDLELSTKQGGSLAFVTSKEEQRGYKIFIDMKDGRKYMQEFGFNGIKREDHIRFVLFGASS